MIHTNPEHVVCFDCDDTLVMWGKKTNDVYIKDPYTDSDILLKKHNKHIKLLQDYKARGYYVVVWSAGGYLWAKAVVEGLGLRDSVDHIMAKPVKYVDDLDATEILGTRVYLKDDEETS